MHSHINEQVYPVLQAVENAPNVLKRLNKVKNGTRFVLSGTRMPDEPLLCSAFFFTNRGQQTILATLKTEKRRFVFV